MLVALAFAAAARRPRRRALELGGRRDLRCSRWAVTEPHFVCGDRPRLRRGAVRGAARRPPSPASEVGARLRLSAARGATGRRHQDAAERARLSAGRLDAAGPSSRRGPLGGSSAPSGRPAQRDCAGRARQAGDEALHRHAVDLDDRRRAPRSCGSASDVGHVVDGRGGGLRRLERGQHLVERARRAERRHAARRSRRAPRSGRRTSCRSSSPSPISSITRRRDRLGRRRHRDPAAVRASPGAARHRVGDARAEPRAGGSRSAA